MDITKSRGLKIAVAAVFVFGFGLTGISAASATETPPPTPDPTASLTCSTFSEGVNSATATGTLTMDAALEQVTVKFEVDTASGSYVGTQDFTSTGNYSITVPNIPATTQAQLTVTASYIFNQESISVTHTGTCSTDASVTINGPAVTPTPTPTPTATTPPATTPPAASGSNGGGTTVKKYVPKAATDGFAIAQAQTQQQNDAILLSILGAIALGTVVTIVVVRRRQAGARS